MTVNIYFLLVLLCSGQNRSPRRSSHISAYRESLFLNRDFPNPIDDILLYGHKLI